jgi:hypothetical protein
VDLTRRAEHTVTIWYPPGEADTTENSYELECDICKLLGATDSLEQAETLDTPARASRFEGAVVQQRKRPRRCVTAGQPAPCPGQPRSLPQEDPERSGGGLRRSLEGPATSVELVIKVHNVGDPVVRWVARLAPPSSTDCGHVEAGSRFGELAPAPT